MIWDYFRTDDPVTRVDMERIGALIYGDMFLKGLGVHAKHMVAPPGFSIVTDIVQVDEYISPKVLWDLPEPRPYCELHGVIEEEAGRLQFTTGIPDERREEIDRTMEIEGSRFGDQLFDLILLKYRQNDIENHLFSFGNGEQFEEKFFKHVALDLLQNSIYGSIRNLIDAAYFGGLEASPIFERIIQGFETGGMPCGWLGPQPRDGGDPIAAVALLHFGNRVDL